MRNVIGTLPGELDRSSLGHGGKYSYCIAENETASSPWPPFHTTRGFQRDQNAVTVFAALAPHQISNQLSAEPEGVLTTMSPTCVSRPAPVAGHSTRWCSQASIS
jgi:hypothetical protein